MKNIAALPWLPSAPEDFRAQCKSIASAEDVRFLATHALDLTQLGQLARAMERLPTLDPLTPFRLAIMSSTTVDFLLPHLKVSGARHGLGMELFASPYGQVMQQVMDSDSEVNRFKADAVLLYLDHHFFPGVLEIGNADALRAAVQAAIRQTSALRQALRQTGATVIVTTMAPPPLSLFGHLDTRIPGTGRTFADAYNAALLESLEQSADVLMDVATLAETVGLYTWHDAREWLLAKIPFSMECVPLFAEHIARIVACLRGKARKCLVLDLDNTVWGGVIGDDGLDGIKIGNGSALGEAHLEVQRAALSLRQRGIVLAVSSKNNDDIARLPFQAHPDMLLREEHIAVFQANWQDKASNLVAIAKTLNIGIDALVFLDDNPAERALVRQVLPQVAVPELPNDAALFPQILMNAGYFEALYFSDEDRQRAEQYQANGIRASLEQISADLPTYLRSLQMVIQFSAFDIVGRARIAQLINKSNQFNLTTRRYTEADIDAMLSDPSIFTLQVRLADRFGDNGMISVIICRPKDQVLVIDTWLMSCRVLKRQVEFAVLNEIMIEAKSRGIHQVHGTYIPSGKNELVRNHYAELGFTKVCAGDDGATEWSMDVAGYQIQDIPMVVQKVTSNVQST
jgi:FkbH-like protein